MIDKITIKKFYNDVYRKGDIRDNSRLYRWIISLINPVASGRLLDVGCGVGCLLYEANKRNINVFGLDVSYEALAKARKMMPSMRASVADGERLPFKDDSFDSVVSLGSIEHFLHPERGIEEIGRVSKINGKIVLLLPNSFYLGDVLKVLFRGRSDEQWQIQEKLLTRDQWRLFIESNGLKVDKIYRYNKYPEFFQEGTLKVKSLRKYIKTFFMKYLCPFNLSWTFVYVCRKV
jgi:SAM-dependent methyltransferase